MIFLIVVAVVILFQVIVIGINQRRGHREIMEAISRLEEKSGS
jgi:hypothetical protein